MPHKSLTWGAFSLVICQVVFDILLVFLSYGKCKLTPWTWSGLITSSETLIWFNMACTCKGWPLELYPSIIISLCFFRDYIQGRWVCFFLSFNIHERGGLVCRVASDSYSFWYSSASKISFSFCRNTLYISYCKDLHKTRRSSQGGSNRSIACSLLMKGKLIMKFSYYYRKRYACSRCTQIWITKWFDRYIDINRCKEIHKKLR